MKRTITYLLALNSLALLLHIYLNCKDFYYFCQLTIMGQTLVIANFALSFILNEQKSSHQVRLFLSRLHLMTIGVQVVVALGFWSIRIFLGKQFVDNDAMNGLDTDYFGQLVSIYMHGGNLLTMLTFFRLKQIIAVSEFKNKVFIHFCYWALPFLFVQCLRWSLSGQHIYGFIAHMSWPVLISFQLLMLIFAVGFDYMCGMLHGTKLEKKIETIRSSLKMGHNSLSNPSA